MTDYNITVDYLIDKSVQKYIYLFISGNRYLNVLTKHRRRDTTITTYASAIRMLIRAIGEIKGVYAELRDLTEDDIYILMGMLPGREHTVQAKLNILGGWMEFETGNNLIRKMKLLWNREEPHRTFITKEQFDHLYSFARNDCERIIMNLGSQMGLRMSEIRDIEMDDIDGGILTIYGKGHGEGKIVEKTIPEGLRNQIEDYIEGERAEVLMNADPTDALLLQNCRNHKKGIPITTSMIVRFYKRISEESGIYITSHVMRRLYCTLLADEAGLRSDLDTLRRMMRHESIETTIGCYLDADTRKISEAQLKIEEIFGTL